MAALTANTCERTADVLLVFERPLAEQVQVSPSRFCMISVMHTPMTFDDNVFYI